MCKGIKLPLLPGSTLYSTLLINSNLVMMLDLILLKIRDAIFNKSICHIHIFYIHSEEVFSYMIGAFSVCIVLVDQNFHSICISVSLCWKCCVTSTNVTSLFLSWFCSSFHTKILHFCKLSSVHFCNHCSSILLAQNKTCSLVTSLMSFVSVSSNYFCQYSLVINDIYELHSVAFILNVPIHSSVDLYTFVINLQYCRIVLFHCNGV